MRIFRVLVLFSFVIISLACKSAAEPLGTNSGTSVQFEFSYSIELKGVTSNFVGLYFQQYPGFEPKGGLLSESGLALYGEALTMSGLHEELTRLKGEFKHDYAIEIRDTKEGLLLTFSFEYIDAFEQRGFLFQDSDSGVHLVHMDFKQYKENQPDHGYVIRDIPVPH